jgi:hypothetical protein
VTIETALTEVVGLRERERTVAEECAEAHLHGKDHPICPTMAILGLPKTET